MAVEERKRNASVKGNLGYVTKVNKADLWKAVPTYWCDWHFFKFVRARKLDMADLSCDLESSTSSLPTGCTTSIRSRMVAPSFAAVRAGGADQSAAPCGAPRSERCAR